MSHFQYLLAVGKGHRFDLLCLLRTEFPGNVSKQIADNRQFSTNGIPRDLDTVNRSTSASASTLSTITMVGRLANEIVTIMTVLHWCYGCHLQLLWVPPRP
uniref:Uncharacterized protein n=1 Tax=Triticum urartu TaxID=4572 RepID=A0A8R7R3B3_TRIUA